MDRKKTKAKIGPRLAAVLIGLMTYVLLFGLLIAAARPEQYDLRVGQVSPLTITATKDVEDTVTTQQLVDAAVAAVQPNYISDTTVMPKVLENLENAFAAMEAIRALADRKRRADRRAGDPGAGVAGPGADRPRDRRAHLQHDRRRVHRLQG